MIRSQDVNKEVKKLDDIAKDSVAQDGVVLRGILKAVTLAVKLIRDVRTNQVEIMKKSGVELIKEERQKNDATE